MLKVSQENMVRWSVEGGVFGGWYAVNIHFMSVIIIILVHTISCCRFVQVFMQWCISLLQEMPTASVYP